MPITLDELTGTPAGSDVPDPETGSETSDSAVRIVEWVDEIPKQGRTSPFDPVINQIRQVADPTQIARIEWGAKPISPNKVNQLRKRFPDCEFKQVTTTDGRNTYVSYRGDAAAS